MDDLPRTVLISGCSSGIGLELAVQLARDSRQRYQGKWPRAGRRGAGVGMASAPLGGFHQPFPSSCICGLGEDPGPVVAPSHLSLGINPSSNEHFLSAYWMPGTVLGAGNTAVNKTDPEQWYSGGGEGGQTISRFYIFITR